MSVRSWSWLVVGLVLVLGNAEARTYRRSCTGGLWVTYYSDAYHLHTLGWLNRENAKATARSSQYEPSTLRGRARDRLKNDCFQQLECSGEIEVAGRMVNMSTPWPYGSTYDEIAAQIEEFVCQDARLNFRDVRDIRAEILITGDTNCGLANRKTFRADFFSKTGSGASEIICSGRYPR